MKKNNLYTLFLILSTTLFLSNCVSYIITEENERFEIGECEIVLPKGWNIYKNSSYSIIISKTGLPLQYIHITKKTIGKKLKYTKKVVKKDMLPHEIAEIDIDNLRFCPDYSNLKVIENTPVTIAGRSGYKFTISFTNPDNLSFKRTHFGFTYNGILYRFMYQAVERFYYKDGLKTLESAVLSSKIISE